MVDGSILSDHPPNRVRVWLKLIGNWPTLTSGGCRFLLQARIKFIHQMETLRKLNYSWRFGVVLPEISQELREYARFGISRLDLKRVIWTEEVPESRGFELGRPVSLESPMLVLDLEKDKCNQILKFCSQNGRIQKLAIVEWCRMNPNQIVNFLRRMDSDKDYKMYFRPIYDNIRLIFWRVVNRPTIKIPLVDEAEDEKLKRQLMRAQAMMEKSRIELEAYSERAKYLEEMVNSTDLVERSRWREKLPQLPEWKLRRKRKRELRRQAEQEESSRKRRRCGSMRSRLGSRSCSQGPKTSSESEQESEDSDLERAYAGADEPAPRCRRVVTEKARKKKGQKKKGECGLSEEILKELIDVENYEYPGKKKTESDEEFETGFRHQEAELDYELETQFMETI